VTSLVQGVYKFELKGTDAGGLFSKDITQTITARKAFTNRGFIKKIMPSF